MQTQLLQTIPGYKLYNNRSICIGTFIGGPLAAGYLFAENYKHLGQRENANKSWLYAFGITLILIGTVLRLPSVGNIPYPLIPLLHTSTASFLYKIFQAKRIIHHINKGGQVYAAWRSVYIGGIGMLTMLGIALLLIFHLDG